MTASVRIIDTGNFRSCVSMAYFPGIFPIYCINRELYDSMHDEAPGLFLCDVDMYKRNITVMSKHNTVVAIV